MDDETRIAEIRERAEAAPTGPWSATLNAKRTWNHILVFGGTEDEYLLAKVADDDATDLLVNARVDTLYLLDRLRTAEAEVETLTFRNLKLTVDGNTAEARAAEAEADRDAIAAQVEELRRFFYETPGETPVEPFADRAAELLVSARREPVLARVKAEAWDEGFNASMRVDQPRLNPYRKAGEE